MIVFVICKMFRSKSIDSLTVGFSGWVKCELIDADGKRHVIRDKVPIFTAETLDASIGQSSLDHAD